MWVCVFCVCYVHVYIPDKGIRSHVTVVIDGCEGIYYMGTEN